MSWRGLCGGSLVAAGALLTLAAAAVRLVEVFGAPAPARIAATVVIPHEIKRLGPPVVTGTVVVHSARMVQTADEEWSRQLRDPGFWSKQRSGGGSNSWSPGSTGAARPSQLGAGWPDPLSPFGNNRGGLQFERGWGMSTGAYRTLCVRTCDGFYWPVSFATTRSNFERDAARCESTCAGAKLYVYRNPGEEVDDMKDLRGQPYSRLPTAFLYRTQYDAGCKCHPHPWEEASRLRHRIYALEAASRRGDKVASSQLKDIRDTARKSRDSRRSSADKARGGNGTATGLAEATEVHTGSIDPALANALGGSFQAKVPSAKKARSSNAASRKTRAGSVTRTAELSAPPALAPGGAVVMRLGAQPPRVVKVRPARTRTVSSGALDWSVTIAGR